MLIKYNVDVPLFSYHAFNEHKIFKKHVNALLEGKKISLISDAGTPSISDPGYLLVREAIKNGVEIDCLPGPTAFVPALVNSGISTDRFVFEGFLPTKKGRNKRIEIKIQVFSYKAIKHYLKYLVTYCFLYMTRSSGHREIANCVLKMPSPTVALKFGDG